MEDNSASINDSSNYFSQEWAPGTLETKDSGISIDETKQPTDENEKTYANALQNYYIYEPLNKETNSVLNQTSFYKPNPEMFNILEVFKPLDQGHDFYVTSRNVKGNWTQPPKENTIDTGVMNNDGMTNYVQFQLNTSFGGGKDIFGLIYIKDESYKLLKQDKESLDINDLLKIINDDISKSNYDMNSFLRPSGKQIQFTLNGSQLEIINPFEIGNLFENGNPVENGIPVENVNQNNVIIGKIEIYSLYSKGYNSGLHRFWDFDGNSHVYALQLTKNTEDKFEFKGYKLYECNIVIPEFWVSISELIANYKTDLNAKNDSDIIKKINKELSTIKDEIAGILERDESIDTSLTYGNTLILSISPNDIRTNKAVCNFFIEQAFKYYYSKIKPEISKEFKPFNAEQENKIEQAKIKYNNNPEVISKIPVSVPDASTAPSTDDLIKSLRDMDNEDSYPKKYSIVSANVDGSKLGGQIKPTYHPPELSIYMTIFDKDNNFHGFIYRICFLKKINTNKLNQKSQISVDMYYCFFHVQDFENVEGFIKNDYKGENLDEIKNLSSKITDFILKNTVASALDSGDTVGRGSQKRDYSSAFGNDKIEFIGSGTYMLKTGVNGTDKEWYKFTLISDAPSVEEINKAVRDMKKKAPLIKDKLQTELAQQNKSMIPPTLSLSSMFNNIGQMFNLIAHNSDPDSINNIIKIGIRIFLNDQRLKNVYGNTTDGNGELGEGFINFLRTFLIRNKYIGDNSRATDTLYNNKDMIINPIQFSNDVNTLSTAKMLNISSMLASGSSSIKYLFIAPYITENDKYVISTFKSADDKRTEFNKSKETQDSSDSAQPEKISKRRKIDVEPSLILTDKRRNSSGTSIGGMTFKRVSTDALPIKPRLVTQDQVPQGSQDQGSQGHFFAAVNRDLAKDDSPTSAYDEIYYANNNIKYLQEMLSSIKYIDKTITTNDNINNFIVKRYLEFIKNNLENFSKGLNINKLVRLIEANINDGTKSLEIKSDYNSFFKEFSNINGLILNGYYIQDDDSDYYKQKEEGTEVEGPFKTKYNYLIDKLDNLFDFTDQRVNMLNTCLNDFSIEIDYYNRIIIPIYEYLSGYYYNELANAKDQINKNGFIAFIGIYYFFINFTIDFNNKLNEKFENETKLVEKNYLNNDLLQNWFNTYIEKKDTKDQDNSFSSFVEIEYSEYIDFSGGSNNNENDFITKILKRFNNNNIVFTTYKTNETLIEKSLYFLLDDDFIKSYFEKVYPNGCDDDVDIFLTNLYMNNLYGLIVGEKVDSYISDTMKEYLRELIETYNKPNKRIKSNLNLKAGQSLKNKKKYKRRITIKNKSKPNKNKITRKKHIKKMTRYTQRR